MNTYNVGNPTQLSERFHQSTLDALSAHIAILDESGKIVEVNEAWNRFARANSLKVAGLDVGANYLSVCERSRGKNAEEANAVASGIRAVIGGETKEFRLEYPCHGPREQRWFIVRVTGFGVDGERRIVVAHENITERRKAEENLKVCDLALKSVSQGVIITDPNRRILTANAAFTSITGYDNHEILGQNCRFLQGPLTNSHTVDTIRLALKNATEFSGEILNYRKDGTAFWNELTISPLRDEYGKLSNFVGVTRDISQRKSAEAEMLKAKQAADMANRAKSEFLANMSHELRTPMTAIMGYADLLMEEINDDLTPEKRINDVQIIKRNGEHLLAIIDDILDLSKIEAGKLSVESILCSPMAIIEDVLSLMRVRSLAKGLALDVFYETLMPARIHSDPTRLRQILVNLVGNAIKFTELGSVRLMVRFVAGNVPTLEFDVVDAGIGMSPEQQGRLFKPFVQADTTMTRKFGGTGLGLTICKRLAELLGGDVHIVESVLGKGSRFRVAIATGPLDGVEMIDPSGNVVTVATKTCVAISQEPPCSLAGSRILLAEDGPDNQQLIAFVIKKAGADVTVVENGQLAVDAALQAVEAGQPFHVILMDMQMPVLDGYGAVALLRAKAYRHPIIALTAHSMTGDREKCIAAGCNDYATKPINKASLISTCQKWLEAAQDESAPMDHTAEMAKRDANAQSQVKKVLVSELAEDPDIGPLIGEFLSRLSPNVRDMTEYLSTNRLDELAKLAHQLTGAGGGYGFPSISEAAQRVEQHAKSDLDLEEIQRAVAELTTLCRQAIAGVTCPDGAVPNLPHGRFPTCP